VDVVVAVVAAAADVAGADVVVVVGRL